MAININLELTDHCNIRCKMCSQSMRPEAHGAPKKFMSWATWRASLKNLSDFPEAVHLCPHWLGEPTMHPHFEQFIEYAFAINQDNCLFEKFKLHTNAVQLSKSRSQLLLKLGTLPFLADDTFHFIHFSVDAFSSPIYKEVKGRDCRDRVYQNIEDFLTERSKVKCAYPKITIAFVVQPENANEALEFQHYWRSVFDKLKLPLQEFYDWPSEECDNLYFRRLNCDDQIAYSLGLTDTLEKSLKTEGSF